MHPQHRLDRHDWLAGLAAGAILGLVFLGVGARAGMRLRPVTVLNAGIFVPLFIVHGALLHAYWCRVHLARHHRRAPLS